MNVLSLFSGIGGFDLGFERAGMEIMGVCDVDKYALDVLSRHFPNAKQFTDVREIGEKTHERGSVNVICGGFPCQDVSIAGKRKGLAGERSGLWSEFARIIDELEPRWVIVENVAGLLSSNKGRDFATILRWLVERGYGVCWRVFDSQYFGVAQRPRRVFIVASFGNGSAAEILFEQEGMRWNTPTRGKARQGIANTFTIRSGSDGGRKGYLGAEDKAMTLGGQPQYLETARMTAFGEYSNDGTASILKQRDYKDATDLVWEMSHAKEAYRETKGGITPTLQSRMGTGGNQVPMVGVRRLTPTECSRLQGFPDDWNEWLSDTQRYKQFGNAVTVNVAEWIGKRIIKTEERR